MVWLVVWGVLTLAGFLRTTGQFAWYVDFTCAAVFSLLLTWGLKGLFELGLYLLL
jgi:hypothetical protein